MKRGVKKELKVNRSGRFGLSLGMITASVLLLTHVSLAQVLLIAPPKISLGSVKPGDTVESKKRILIKFSEAIDVQKIRISPVEEEEFILELEGNSGIEILGRYSCEKVFWNKQAGIIHVEVIIKVNEIKWAYAPGKYRGEIIITFSESNN